MRYSLISAVVLAAALMAASAQAATYSSQSGFGTGGGFSSCKTANTSGAFATGQVIASGDYDNNCVGAFTVNLDTTAQTITLTGFEYGNYDEGFLEIMGISELTITGLSTVSYLGLFDPDFYSEPAVYGATPAPQLSFTGNSVKILFSAFGESPGQFTYDGNGGQAVFSYSTGVGAVPEPASWALMIGGFGMAGATLRRRRALSVA